ncbi:MAG: hypothetical protein OXC03_05475 [Flavobacteriaceae bacterium]|nr:hypothetical protein [Flavobacteriaceae bacterium]
MEIDIQIIYKDGALWCVPWCFFITLYSCSLSDDTALVLNPAPYQIPALSKIKIVTSAGVGGSRTDIQNVANGQQVIITATAKEYFQLKEWTGECGNFDKNDLEITITASKNCAVRAENEMMNKIFSGVQKSLCDKLVDLHTMIHRLKSWLFNQYNNLSNRFRI